MQNLASILVPMAITQLYNLTILVLISRSVRRHKKAVGKSQTESSSGSMGVVRVVSLLSILLGMTWSFSVLVVLVDRIELEYLFAVLNSLHGFFIFILHTARSEEAQRAWLSALPFSTRWSKPLRRSSSLRTRRSTAGISIQGLSATSPTRTMSSSLSLFSWDKRSRRSTVILN